ncbi:hypothetical protein QEN19_003822 [Hanseniaspora menglaensis]
MASNSSDTINQDPSSNSQLQPRKRAKTSEEKEQRRMERILRNRRAAHKSRERKRFYLNLYQEKSEKYDVLFKKLIETGILESNPIFSNDTHFTKLKEELYELNKKQDKFERENGTVNSSVPKKDQNPSDDEDEDEEEQDNEGEASSDTSSKQLKKTANALLFLDEEPITKKRKLNSRKDSSSTVFSSSSSATPKSNTLFKSDDSFDAVDENNYNAIISPSTSITTIKNNEELVFSKHDLSNSKINPLDLSLELGIDLEEPVYSSNNINSNLLLDSEVDDLLIMQRYPAVIIV